jgi:hypothetical protein
MSDWNDPQLSDGDMPQPVPTQLDELNDYLRMLADMDRIGIRRKIVLLEGYLDMVKSKTNNSDE